MNNLICAILVIIFIFVGYVLGFICGNYFGSKRPNEEIYKSSMYLPTESYIKIVRTDTLVKATYVQDNLVRFSSTEYK